MTDLRSVSLQSLGGPQEDKKKNMPVIRMKRKRKAKANVSVSKPEEVEVVLDHLVQEREELKRSRTADDMHSDRLEDEVSKLQSEIDIQREKAESLAAESEAKDLIIYQLKAQLAKAPSEAPELKEGYEMVIELEKKLASAESNLLAKEQERAEWQAQAESLVEEGNAAIEEGNARIDEYHKKYSVLYTRYHKLLEDHQILEEDAEFMEETLKKQDRKIMSLSSHRNDVKLTEETAIMMLEDRESRLVAALAALTEGQKRIDVIKRREAKITKDLQQTRSELKEVKAENDEWTRKWATLNRGQGHNVTTKMTPEEESVELSKLKSSNIMLEFNFHGVKEDLAKEKKERTRLQTSVDGIIRQRDEIKKSKQDALKENEKLVKKLRKTIENRLEEIVGLKKIIEEHDNTLQEIKDRAARRHDQAMKRAQESEDAAVERAKEDYCRIQLEHSDMENRFKEVCKEADDLRRSMEAAGSPAALEQKVQELDIELMRYKESYAAIVEKNKKWSRVHKEALDKNAEWKKAEVSWVAEKARLEDEISAFAQRLMILEHRATSTRDEAPVKAPVQTQEGAQVSWEYLATIESLAGGFVVNFERTMGALVKTGFEPGPILKDTFSKFSKFREDLTKMMKNRTNGKSIDQASLTNVISFIGIDLSKEHQLFPMQNATSVYHLVMSLVDGYVESVNAHRTLREEVMSMFKHMNETIGF